MNKEAGTTENEQTLNTQTDVDFFGELTAAMAAGDDAKVNKLMSAPLEIEEPDSAKKEEDTSEPAKDKEEKQEQTLTPEQPPTPADEPAEVKALREELHAIKSRIGRVDSVQSQLAAIKKMVEEQAARLAAVPEPLSEVDKKLESLKEIDPLLAETLAAIREETKPPAPKEQAPQPDDAEDGELARVRRVHPDVDLILVGGAARPAWEQWKSTLTPQQLAYAESGDAVEFSLALSAFKAYAAQQAAPAQQSPNQSTADPTQDATAKAVEEERKRKLSATPGSKNPPIKTVGEETIVNPDDVVRKLMSEIQKRDNLIR